MLDIIAIALCGVISSAQSWVEIEDFAQSHQQWFKLFLSLPNGTSSHDTISRVLSALDFQAFQASSLQWLRKISNLIPETIIPIDGKSLRGSKCKTTCKQALHVVNAWPFANGISLGQLQVEGTVAV